MAIKVTSAIYMEYIQKAADKITENKDYITSLDADTGDGDHWANINMGFQSLLAEKDKLLAMPIYQQFKRIGMLMMSKIGGSSGILYGGAYVAASKAVDGKEELNAEDLCKAYETMVNDMMERGKAKPGFKTMIDSLYPAVQVFKKDLAEGKEDTQLLDDVKKAAEDGAESTRAMEAVKGRASYQTNKGVGHLDPGAVTMSYQIATLCDCLKEHL